MGTPPEGEGSAAHCAANETSDAGNTAGYTAQGAADKKSDAAGAPRVGLDQKLSVRVW